NHHVDFKEIKAIGNKKVFDYLRKVKAKMLPYVETENDSWSGYRPDRLRKMIENKS
ncbi:glutaredoxin, partial [Oenococcus oeni]